MISVVDFRVMIVVLKMNDAPSTATLMLRVYYAPTTLVPLLSSADSPCVSQLRFSIRLWVRFLYGMNTWGGGRKGQ